MNESSEDVLTRHLLKLSEIENQFQELTNKFEEINFKLDKLSNRMSKAQADNQIRFQDLEKSTLSVNNSNEIKDKNDILPGSSQPQDLGSVSYKDTSTNELSQKTQSIDTTSSIVTETFVSEKKYYQTTVQINNMNLRQVFLKLEIIQLPKERLESLL